MRQQYAYVINGSTLSILYFPVVFVFGYGHDNEYRQKYETRINWTTMQQLSVVDLFLFHLSI